MCQLPVLPQRSSADVDSWQAVCVYTAVGSRCSADHFKNMRMVFDTTFCGSLALGSWLLGIGPQLWILASLKLQTNPSRSQSSINIYKAAIKQLYIVIQSKHVQRCPKPLAIASATTWKLMRSQGDYAGSTFQSSCPWLKQSCEDYVRNNPDAFSHSADSALQ